MKSNYSHHFFGILILLLHYLFPLIFFGNFIAGIHDNLDAGPVINNIISKIYKGSFDSINIFLSGEFKWYFLDKIFFPINLFHLILDAKSFYFFEEFLKKILAYWSFYIFAKKFFNNRSYCVLGALIFVSTVYMVSAPAAYGLPLMPYLLYLLTSKKNLEIKHYFVIFLIGLNTSIVHEYLALMLLIPLGYLLNDKKNKINILFKYFVIISISSLIVATPIFMSVLLEDLHREDFIKLSFVSYFFESLRSALPDISWPHTIFHVPKEFLYSILIFFGLFLKNKKALTIIFFIFFIFLIKTILGSNLTDMFFQNIFSFLKGFNFARIEKIYPLLFSILLILILLSLKSIYWKKIIITLAIISSISFQLMIPASEFGRLFLKNNLIEEDFLAIKKLIKERKFYNIFKINLNKQSFNNNDLAFRFESEQSFDNYYKFSQYEKIRKLVNGGRTMSVGLDPMIAAMNDIKVIDGYHNTYPMNYKKRFRKIIERELENNIKLKNYYDNWGNRVYAFYNDQNNLMLNFQHAKKLGADYVISKFPIKNSELKIVYYKRNNSSQIFLYRIL